MSWPSCLSSCQFTIFPDGSVQLSSLEDHASVCLASHRRAFTVRFLAKLSDDNLNRSETDCKSKQTLFWNMIWLRLLILNIVEQMVRNF